MVTTSVTVTWLSQAFLTAVNAEIEGDPVPPYPRLRPRVLVIVLDLYNVSVVVILVVVLARVEIRGVS
jgi:hypothetical protein